MGGDDVRKGAQRQGLEDLRVAEEGGDVDQQVRGQVVKFRIVRGQAREIRGGLGDLQARQPDAPLDPATDRARLVEAEIHVCPVPDQIEDGLEDRRLARRSVSDRLQRVGVVTHHSSRDLGNG